MWRESLQRRQEWRQRRWSERRSQLVVPPLLLAPIVQLVLLGREWDFLDSFERDWWCALSRSSLRAFLRNFLSLSEFRSESEFVALVLGGREYGGRWCGVGGEGKVEF